MNIHHSLDPQSGSEHQPKSHERKRKEDAVIELKINKNTVMSVILIILVGFSAVQAVELSRIKSSIEEGNVFTSTAEAAETTTTSAPSSGSSAVDNLPDMVGGC